MRWLLDHPGWKAAGHVFVWGGSGLGLFLGFALVSASPLLEIIAAVIGMSVGGFVGRLVIYTLMFPFMKSDLDAQRRDRNAEAREERESSGSGAASSAR